MDQSIGLVVNQNNLAKTLCDTGYKNIVFAVKKVCRRRGSVFCEKESFAWKVKALPLEQSFAREKEILPRKNFAMSKSITVARKELCSFCCKQRKFCGE